jgi:hypothetical protein
MPGGLLRSILVALLDEREMAPLAARFRALEDSPLPPRADNCLRFVACMQATADVLGANREIRMANERIDEALHLVENKDYLWTSLVDLALGLALRWGDRQRARELLVKRMDAPLGTDLHALGFLMNAIGRDSPDTQTLPDLGYLAADAALLMTGTAVASTLLGLAALHGTKQFPSDLINQVRLWNSESQRVERSTAKWSLNSQDKHLSLSVDVRGSGDLHACAGWALDDLVYGLPGHLDQLLRKQVPLELISGVKTRSQVTTALSEGHLTIVAQLHGIQLSQDDCAALVARQDAALAWIRHRHSVMRGVQANLRIVVSDDRQ